MRKALYLPVLFLIFISHNVNSQDLNSVIRGKVLDNKGFPLPGASVSIKDIARGVNSDSEGIYTIFGLADTLYTISISFMGYETVSEKVNLKGIAVVDVSLEPKSFITDEVRVNASRAGDRAPLAYSTIENSILKKQNTGSDLPYLLSLTPSLVETSEAGNGIGYTSMRIRGTDGSRINVTIDGIPLNDPESQQVFWVDLPDLASSIENIQVQRGVGTSSNGAGAFGATISIQTLNLAKEPFAEISSSLGSFNTFKNMVSVGTGLLADKYSFQMRYSDIKSDGFIDRTGSNHRSAYISGSARTEKSVFKANIILGEEHTSIGWWGVPAEMLAINRRYNPAGEYTDESEEIRYYDNESDNYSQNHLQLIYNLKLTDFITLNTALHYTKGKGYYEEYREDQSLGDYGISPYVIGDSIISSSDIIRRKWLSNDFYGLVYSLKYKKSRVEAIAGGGMNLYYGDHFGNIIWMQNAGPLEKDYRWYLNDSRKQELSVYGKINYSLSERTSVFGDLQYRFIDYKMNGMDDDQRDISQNHNFGFFNPKAGFFFSVTPKQDAYISFSVANREPTRADYKEASGDPSATPRPETLYDTEIGYKFSDKKNSYALNLYAMLYDDQLVPTGELSDVGYSITTNVDKSYRVGVEIISAIKISEIIGWNMNLTLSRNKILNFTEYYVNYNTSDWSSEYLSRNLGLVDIAYSPSMVFSSDILFTIVNGLDLHLLSKYVGNQYFDNTMNDDRTIDPYFINSVRIDFLPAIKRIRDMELQLLVNNILNESYESNAYGGNWFEDGNEKTWAYYFPQAGINFLVRASLKF